MVKKPQLSLKGRALRYLSMREHSRLELARKLTPYVQEGEDLEEVLNFLERSNFLSNQRFSESLVNRRQSRFGNQRIFAELVNHDLSADDMAEVKEKLQGSEIDRAIEVLHKKFSSGPTDHMEKAKQMKFLMQRGFSSKAVQQALRAPRLDEEDGRFDS
ncbi:recombination regulator RecX [Undibacterium sp. LX40W]|uniref:Regulatory protein RecX n=1 Tax=Undibacterium nitidum TaxID=2762298 RepID=A0A923HK34_9BURK|nr:MULTISPECIES: recombination regulator RecX [Undibacterium]MBC3880849.1 recombination regulator RecX [Undibacterium nitidum]MBC3890418.1 recombination regulator RecX [Undibacterium sp. LX40W]